MTYGFIYKIEFPNGKHYIGLTTTSLEQRQGQHKYCVKKGDTTCLYNALRKYNMEDTFELIEIDTADTQDKLCELEIGYIQMYNSYYKDDCGYNMTFGGETSNGYIHTEEHKQKQSVRRKKYFEDNPEVGKEHGEKIKKYYEKNPEVKKQQSEAKKKYYEYNPEAIQQAIERSKKQFENPQARRNLSDGKGKNKPFDVFTKDGTFVKTFCYQFEAKNYLQKEHNITSKINVCQVLSGHQKSSKGFVFKYR
jgi:hypothetical protein